MVARIPVCRILGELAPENGDCFIHLSEFHQACPIGLQCAWLRIQQRTGLLEMLHSSGTVAAFIEQNRQHGWLVGSSGRSRSTCWSSGTAAALPASYSSWAAPSRAGRYSGDIFSASPNEANASFLCPAPESAIPCRAHNCAFLGDCCSTG